MTNIYIRCKNIRSTLCQKKYVCQEEYNYLISLLFNKYVLLYELSLIEEPILYLKNDLLFKNIYIHIRFMNRALVSILKLFFKKISSRTVCTSAYGLNLCWKICFYEWPFLCCFRNILSKKIF